jgi:hypothetical protein
MAEVLRLFVVTWDPLEWLVPRPEAVATANGWPLEVIVYVSVWSLAEMAKRQGTTMAAVLAGLGGRAVTTAAAHEDTVTSGRYAQLVARGQVPDLLSGEPVPAFGPPAITAMTPSWDAIGLGAITDFVQQAFGPVELDRSLVEFTATTAPLPGCPACAGRRFKFPAGLAESQDRMCLTHQKEADVVIRRRLGEAVAGFAGRPDDFGSALAKSQDQAERFPAWPVALIRDLGRAGQGPEAVTLSEALAITDPARHGLFAGEAAAALAEAGLAKDAKAIRDLSTRIFQLTRPAGETVQRRQPRSRPPRPQRKGRR